MQQEQENVEAVGAKSAREIASLCRSRAATYGLLARLFRTEVDEALLSQLKASRFPAETGDEDVDRGYYLIASYLGTAGPEALIDLAVDYVRTFIGHGVDARGAAFPYESVYTSERRLLMQDARDEVLAIYRAYGMDKDSSWKEPEDHAALELEFERVLIDKTVRLLEERDYEGAKSLLVAQKNFIDGHLGKWVPLLAEDMERFAKTGIYLGLARLTDGWLRLDADFLEDLLSEA